MATEAPLVLARGETETIRGSENDRGLLQSLVNKSGEYEAHLQRFMAAVIPNDGVCVDVGANLGVHTLQMARIARNGHVLAFEPGAESFAFLSENLTQAGIDWATPYPFGLYSSVGQLRFV